MRSNRFVIPSKLRLSTAMSDTSSVYSESDGGNDAGESDTDEEELAQLNSYENSRLMNTDDLSSDDEDADNMNTVGRIPLHWYDAYDHIGYDVTGKKILKRNGKDLIDRAIDNRDDPNAVRTVYDMYNAREIVLSDRDLEIIRRIQAGAFAHPEHEDTPDYVDYFSSIKEVMPLSAAPDPKRRFLPSKWELMRVTKIVKAIREGKYVPIKSVKVDDSAAAYTMWNDTEDEVLAETKRNKFHLPAPKMPLPGHAESYNPPAEYILSAEELEAQEALDDKDRLYNFTPKAHDCLRHVAGYGNFVKERFERCLDLYLCPRKMKRRLNIDPETLVPRLPRPKELKPFPNSLCIQFLGHTKAVNGISISPDGQYLASASSDCTVRLWELDTALCTHVWTLEGPVIGVQFNPNVSHHVLAAVTTTSMVLITTGTGDQDATEVTEALLESVIEQAGKASDEALHWEQVSDDKALGASASERFGAKVGPRVVLRSKENVSSAVWHHKGDYIVVLCPAAGARAVSIHQLSKGKAQYPFTKTAGKVTAVQFHPSRPFLFVATQQCVKVYNLVEQKLIKKLQSGCKWLSSMSIHHSGDHVILGSYDRRVVWFDMDLASTPYKTLKFHEKAIRSVSFHKRYPLMASASDDGTVQIFHSSVYNDLVRSPLVVPLKVLRGHGVKEGLCVLSIEFHPKQPWIVSAGADGIVNLFQDI